MNTRLVYTSAHLDSDEAQYAREDYLEDFKYQLNTGKLVIREDVVKYINAHYVVRIMLESSQLELELD